MLQRGFGQQPQHSGDAFTRLSGAHPRTTRPCAKGNWTREQPDILGSLSVRCDQRTCAQLFSGVCRLDPSIAAPGRAYAISPESDVFGWRGKP